MGTYTIRPGDTLRDIAARCHVSVEKLVQANRIRDPNNVVVGTKLEIPGWSGTDSFGREYTVRPGDSLYLIGKQFGVSAQDLAKANGIGTNASLTIGQVLKIPGAAQAPAATTAQTYTVKSGDSLYKIAQRFGTTAEKLAALNGLSTKAQLSVGQALKLPTASPTPETPTAPSTTPSTTPTGPASLKRFPNSPAKNKAKYQDVARQDLEFAAKYRDVILDTARRTGVDPAVVAAICSRESNCGRLKGPKVIGYDGHGRGLMQIDGRYHGAWLSKHAKDWWAPEVNIPKGVEVLVDIRKDVERKAKSLGAKLTEEQVLTCMVAGYNTGGDNAVSGLVRYGDPDRFTTEKSYSADVLARAEFFRAQGFVL